MFSRDNNFGFRLRISKTVYGKYNLIQMKARYKGKEKSLRSSWNNYDSKLDNNISRAKSNIFSIVAYNRFKYFFTQTVSSLYARSDLHLLISKLRYQTKILRSRYPNLDFYYLVIPEYHSDKKNWHLHGFLSSGYGADSYVNDNGFLSIHAFDNIGWNSISEIKHYEACTKYITKYMTKEMAKDIHKGERLFYCSKGLLRNNIVDDGLITQIAPVHFDFKNEFVFKTTIDENKYYNLITNIDNIQRIHYYEIK